MPPLSVGKKLLARLREDGENLELRVSFHYAGYPAVLLRLARVKAADLPRIAELAWRGVAPRRAVAKWEAERR